MLAIKQPPTLRTGRTGSRVVYEFGSAGVADLRDLWVLLLWDSMPVSCKLLETVLLRLDSSF